MFNNSILTISFWASFFSTCNIHVLLSSLSVSSTIILTRYRRLFVFFFLDSHVLMYSLLFNLILDPCEINTIGRYLCNLLGHVLILIRSAYIEARSNIFKSSFDSWRFACSLHNLVILNSKLILTLQIHQLRFCIPSFTKFFDVQQIDLCILSIHKSLLFF